MVSSSNNLSAITTYLKQSQQLIFLIIGNIFSFITSSYTFFLNFDGVILHKSLTGTILNKDTDYFLIWAVGRLSFDQSANVAAQEVME